MSSPTSSPLTPTSSPLKATQSPSPHSPPQLSPQPSPQPPPPRPLSPASQLALEEAQAAESARYSLRARNQRQLMPYKYDKFWYNSVMAANPDAIVKLKSPHRRRRSSSAAPRERLSDAEDEYQGGDDEELDDDEMIARWRRKGKEKEGADAHAEAGHEAPPRQATPWLPELFNEPSSSSSSGDEAEKVYRQAKLQEKRLQKEQRKKKLKAFPLKRRDLQPSVSPHPVGVPISTAATVLIAVDIRTQRTPSPAREPGLSRPRPRPRPRKLVDEPIVAKAPANKGSGDEEEPAPTWRRRRSVTFISPARSEAGSQPQAPKSPGNAFDGMDDWDDNFPLYEDEFARGQSPLKLLPTQHDAMSVDSFEPHDPPPTSEDMG